ncbi:hypothetical protein T4A_8982 [Trichinella pseudospiralis]|uniref:Uncharacterized protein n=1 Tax=Trichinella pseudospiralis TaxID=6337 RepID=A0A0V1EKH7_TRIPS|nr:hypothetical protein T4A_8982 [Trichinella pseudospiralis]
MGTMVEAIKQRSRSKRKKIGQAPIQGKTGPPAGRSEAVNQT